MNFFRTDGQAALNILLVATRETLDHYLDAVDLVEANLVKLFGEISAQRRGFIHRLEDAVRAAGDLPAVPDPDKEAAEMLLHHVAAFIKSDYVGEILEQRIEGENKLADLVSKAKATELEAPTTVLLDEFALHVSETIKQLQFMYKHIVAQQE